MKIKLVIRYVWLLVVIAVVSVTLTAGCGAPAANVDQPVPQLPARLKIVSHHLDVGYNQRLWVVQDTKTKQEFVVVRGYEASAICPIATPEKNAFVVEFDKNGVEKDQ